MNIQLPDETPIIDIIKFAAAQRLSVRYCRGGNLNLVPKSEDLPEGVRSLPEGVRKVVNINEAREA